MRRRNLFLPENPDVLDMLCRQAAITCEGMTALVGWANAVPDSAQRVGPEHQADDAKRELRLALASTFITPIDAEDIYVMSERLDAVLNGAKDTVRESEVMGIPTRRRGGGDGGTAGRRVQPSRQRRSSGWTGTARPAAARPRRPTRR